MTKKPKVTAVPSASAVWWLHPSVAFSMPVLLAGVVAYETGSWSYLFHWRTAKYFDGSCLGLVLCIVFAFVSGSLMGGARRSGQAGNSPDDWKRSIRWVLVRRLFTLSFVLTMIAYVVWFAVAIKNGLRLSIISEVLHSASGATYDLRDEYLKTIPGVTTATQFGLAVISLGVPLGVVTGWRRVRWQFVAVFVLAFIRSFLNSERLAIIELLIPFIVSYVAFRPPTTRRAQTIIRSAPLFGPVVLFFFFAGAEYFRSWSSFYAKSESSFWSFIGLRLMGYYTTALNNGAMLWRTGNPLSYHLSPMTLDFIWRFPLMDKVIPVVLPSWGVPPLLSDYRYDALLQAAANPELTNPSGVFGPIVDYGVPGGLLYWFVSGLICGYLYKQLKLRKPAGIFLYPVIFIGLAEASRILYWAEGRLFPSMFLLITSVLFILPKRWTPPRTGALIVGQSTISS